MTSRYEFKQVKRQPLVRDPEKEQYDWFAEQVAEIEAAADRRRPGDIQRSQLGGCNE